MRIEIVKMAKALKMSLPDLLTRPVGRSLYGKVKKKLVYLQANEVVELDFKGIDVIDSSFIDEFLVKLITEPDNAGPYFLHLKNVSAGIEMNIKSVFSSYNKFAGRIAVATSELTSDHCYALGELSEQERNILDYLHRQGKITKHECAELLNCEVSEAERLLCGLFELRVIRTQENNSEIFIAL